VLFASSQATWQLFSVCLIVLQWLDTLALRHIERLRKTTEVSQTINLEMLDCFNFAISAELCEFWQVETPPSEVDSMYLTIESPAFKHPVVYHQKVRLFSVTYFCFCFVYCFLRFLANSLCRCFAADVQSIVVRDSAIQRARQIIRTARS